MAVESIISLFALSLEFVADLARADQDAVGFTDVRYRAVRSGNSSE